MLIPPPKEYDYANLVGRKISYRPNWEDFFHIFKGEGKSALRPYTNNIWNANFGQNKIPWVSAVSFPSKNDIKHTGKIHEKGNELYWSPWGAFATCLGSEGV